MKISASERVIGLMLILVNSRHPLEKEEIFKLLPAYKNTTQSKQALDRMFARDKEILRKLGCNLVVTEVKNEAGNSFKYYINVATNLNYIAVTDWQKSLIRSISNIWDDDDITNAIECAIEKLMPINSVDKQVVANSNSLDSVFIKLKAIGRHSKMIIQAISSKKALVIQYFNKYVQIYPLQLIYRNNSWYLLGLDIEQNKAKTYKIERISEITKVYDYNYTGDVDFDKLQLFSYNSQEDEVSRTEKDEGVMKLKAEVVSKLGGNDAQEY
ncbi:MAG: WYL domain-containing protein [Candidatus Ancillula sp.]|nr:WYL domain-containing protein [Candidatus Ancillula sp.]